MFEFATKEFPDNSKLFDSLGEAYFIDENYEKSLVNYEKSLVLNPNNDNAKQVVLKINQLGTIP